MHTPRICELLGVDVGEKFFIDGFQKCTFAINPNGTFDTTPSNVTGSSFALLSALDHPERIVLQPKTNLDNISWERIDEIGKSGEARKYFALGATKKDVMKNGFVAVYRIIGFDHDNLVGGGKAPISWEMAYAYKDKLPMQREGEPVPFGNSDMFEFLNHDFSYLVSDDLSAVVKPVYKVCANSAGKMKKVASRFWLKSEQELFGRRTYSHGNEGSWYEYYRQENVPYYIEGADGDRVAQWLRSPHASTSSRFCCVADSGSAGYSLANISYGFATGFAT